MPDYMVPSYYTQLDEFPKTPNGKTDFRNLPDPKVDVEELVMPESDIEKGVYEIICEILGINNFGIKTDLFKIGLTSLSVIKLSFELFKKFQAELSIVELIDAKNIKNISKLVELRDKSQNIDRIGLQLKKEEFSTNHPLNLQLRALKLKRLKS